MSAHSYTAYTVPTDVVDIADRLALERGGLERSIRLEDRIRKERAQSRGDAQPVPDIRDDHHVREEHDELMRHLGII